MISTIARKLLLVAIIMGPAVLFTVAARPYPYDDEDVFEGEGTYYGSGGDIGSGNCALRDPRPSWYDDMIPVALNAPQYADSLLCGACIEGEGTDDDSPIGKFSAYVADKCPECAFGDLDFRLDGDGRWDIRWRFVKCPKRGINMPKFIFEGSNPYYWKIQPRGTKSPIKKLWVNGVKAERMDDNFFVIQNGPYNGEQLVKTKSILKKRKKQYIELE